MEAINKSQLNGLKNLISQYTNVPLKDFEKLNPEGRKMTRDKEIVWSRYILMYLCQKYGEMTLKTIGELFVIKLDHSTVLHGIKTINNKIDKNPIFKKEIEKIGLTTKKIFHPEEKEEKKEDVYLRKEGVISLLTEIEWLKETIKNKDRKHKLEVQNLNQEIISLSAQLRLFKRAQSYKRYTVEWNH